MTGQGRGSIAQVLGVVRGILSDSNEVCKVPFVPAAWLLLVSSTTALLKEFMWLCCVAQGRCGDPTAAVCELWSCAQSVAWNCFRRKSCTRCWQEQQTSPSIKQQNPVMAPVVLHGSLKEAAHAVGRSSKMLNV